MAENVIETAEPDVVCPAVAADKPDALFQECIGNGQEFAGFDRTERREFLFELGNASALLLNFILTTLTRLQEFRDERVADAARHLV